MKGLASLISEKKRKAEKVVVGNTNGGKKQFLTRRQLYDNKIQQKQRNQRVESGNLNKEDAKIAIKKVADTDTESAEPRKKISSEEVISRLRALGQPIRYFIWFHLLLLSNNFQGYLERHPNNKSNVYLKAKIVYGMI